jgi:hypothetical protein
MDGVQFPPVEFVNDANRKENPQGEGTTVADNLGITINYRNNNSVGATHVHSSTMRK